MISVVFQDLCPHNIAVPFNHGVCASEIERLLWIKGCVNSTEHHICALLSSQSANLIATQSIAGVDSNSHNIPGRNAFDIQLLQCFVNDQRIAKAGGSSSGEYIKPARRDHANAEGLVARINEINFQCSSLKVCGYRSSLQQRRSILYSAAKRSRLVTVVHQQTKPSQS